MRPREYHEYARKTATTGTTAAEFRTAISRAYYATYHIALNFVLGSGGQIGDRDAHRQVRLHLEHSGDPALKAAANDIRLLHNDRKNADYNLDDLSLENGKEAIARVEDADQIIQSLQSSFSGRKGASIRAAITKWVANGKP